MRRRLSMCLITALCCVSTRAMAVTLDSSSIGAGMFDRQPRLHVASTTVVYAMEHDLLRAFDLVDPSNPALLFSRNRLDAGFFAQVIDLGGGSFYGKNPDLTNGWGLFDASDPTDPQLVAELSFDLLAYDGWVDGNSLFLVAEYEPDPFDNSRFVEYSIVDPLNPVFVAEHADFGAFEYFSDVVRHEERVFVLGADAQPDGEVLHYVRHYDFTAWPAAPTLVESVSLGGFHKTRFAALVEDPDGVVAAADAGTLARFHKQNNGNWSTDSIAIAGFGFSEVAGGFRDANGDLHLVGMNPDNGNDPIAIYSYANNGTLSLECNGYLPPRTPEDYLLGPVLVGSSYVLPLDSGAIRVGSYECVGGYAQHSEIPAARLTDFRAARLFAGHAYVGGPGKLDVYDLTNPVDPIYVRSIELSITIEEFDPYDGTTLLAWDRQDGLAVLDLTDPANPSVIAEHTLPVVAGPEAGMPPRLRCSAPYFVVVEGTSGTSTVCDLSVYEFSGFSTLTHHSTTGIAAADPVGTPRPHDVVVHGTTAYVAESFDTQAIDFSTPTLPGVSATLVDRGMELAKMDDVLFIQRRDGQGGTSLYDLSNPVSPAYIDDLSEGGAMVPVGDWLFVRNSSSTVALYDATLRSAPVLYDASCDLNRWPPEASGDVHALGGVYPSSVADFVQLYTLDPATPVLESGESNVSVVLSAFPNPSGGQVRFSWRATNTASHSLSIYDLRGRLVRSLVSSAGPEGMRQLSWQGTDRKGNPVASGTYIVVLDDGRTSSTQKVLLLR